MTETQWRQLLAVLDGERVDPLPVGFIIDSPWLPGWSGMSILDYFVSDTKWFEANRAALAQFPDLWFLPGFWAEYGMCTEPSAFGAKCLFHEHEFPFAEKMFESAAEAARLKKPNPATDGLAPFVLKRLQLARPAIQALGHDIRFAVARGPLNIAAFLMGTTEFLMGLRLYPDETHGLLDTITEYLCDWVQLQARSFPATEGVLFLDDIVGFVSGEDFEVFAKPYLKRCFNAIDTRVRFFHNDAHGLACAPHLQEIGVNLFNFSHLHTLGEMRAAAGESVTLLGNIPPRDVVAQGTPDMVRDSVNETLAGFPERRRLILSCGGGMPPAVSTQNIAAFIGASRA